MSAIQLKLSERLFGLGSVDEVLGVLVRWRVERLMEVVLPVLGCDLREWGKEARKRKLSEEVVREEGLSLGVELSVGWEEYLRGRRGRPRSASLEVLSEGVDGVDVFSELLEESVGGVCSAAGLCKDVKKEALSGKKAEKEALALAKKEALAAKKAEKEALALAKKEAKEAKKAAKETKKNQESKPAPELLASIGVGPLKDLEDDGELHEEAYDDEEEVSVRVFEHEGMKWLKDDTGCIYHAESHEEVGKWNEVDQKIELFAAC